MSAENEIRPPVGGRAVLRREVLSFALAASGVLLQAAMFHPVNAGILAVAAFAPWIILVELRGYAALAAWGYAAGTAFFCLGLFWLASASPVLLALLLVPLGLFPAAAALALRMARTRLGLPYCVSAPLVLTAFEFLRSFIATGFPWLFAGHAFHGSGILIQTADIAGPYGLSLLAFLVNGLIADTALHFSGARKLRPSLLLKAAAATAVLWSSAFAYGALRMGGDFTEGPVVFVVQGNIPQDIKLSGTSTKEIWDRHLGLTLKARGSGADLVVWPETMVPGGLDQESSELAALFDVASGLGAHLLIGSGSHSPAQDGSISDFNSAFFISPSRRIEGRYDKMHLVPGGEYIPFRRVFPAVEGIVLDSLGYAPSVLPGLEKDVFVLPYRGGKVEFSAVICYEIVFAGVVRGFVRDGARFIVNVTNEGWFKDSFEFEQMIAIDKFRAVENRVSIVRAANTGISAVIDPDGKVIARVEGPGGRIKEVEGVLRCAVPLDSRKPVYGIFGDAFAWTVFAAAVALLAFAALPGTARTRAAGCIMKIGLRRPPQT